MIVNKLTPVIGAEIFGVNFSEKLNKKILDKRENN